MNYQGGNNFQRQEISQNNGNFVPYFIPMYVPSYNQFGFNQSNIPTQNLNTFFNHPHNIPQSYDQNYSFQNRKDDYKEKVEEISRPKSSTRQWEDFKNITLKRLKFRQLVMMQAHIKGYYVRRFIVPKKRVMNKMISNFVEKFINESIEDKFVPDLITEVLAYNKVNEDFSLYSTEYKILLELSERVTRKVIFDISRDIAKESVSYLVSDILKRRSENKPPPENDPFKVLIDSFIGNAISSTCRKIAKECIEEVSVEYVFEYHMRGVIDRRYLKSQIEFVIEESVNEIIIEDYIDMMVLKLSQELANPTAVHILDDLNYEYERLEIGKATENLLLRTLMNAAIDKINELIPEEPLENYESAKAKYFKK